MTTRHNFIIAIDGFSSCGKSTVAKALAKKLKFVFIDSGAMYRAVTLYFLREGIDMKDDKAIAEALENIHIDFIPNDDKTEIHLNDEDISDEIRQMYISDMVSEVSTIKAVRQAMVKQQQKLGRRRNIVMDGRDIGTTVFPDADMKIFMTADPQVRANRRYLELTNKGEQVTIDEIVKNLAHRDHIDSTREESPLRKAEDAIVLDNSYMSQEDQLTFVIDEYTKRRASK
ncbi:MULTISPECIES: (d)CMP kinase [Sphingobacterium]|jgi:cytidylate kinase|uniref:Cytidylate kinase n=2 Tax=Sphingobacterium TaxID=28453 RepID=A0ABW5Z1W1_9SPHI|nr:MULTISPECIES: (d)CMP kinase [unclassified Sphingobacterium]MBO6200345.1 (d)CMP kinase [Chryseobacterium sp.]MBB2949750.1 cytidylate kinase [Sphingobacterium sp. JUb56]MCS3554387.1 cytidylate kinase [Sphingobacterium sp. JUb21]NJI73606.1 (d)CMP kinase [Sphingobacterium sp. B16(2022)]QQD13313.1 (d)CMP kinase [Sphingobacterium sp. UDSM-2020]